MSILIYIILVIASVSLCIIVVRKESKELEESKEKIMLQEENNKELEELFYEILKR